MMPAGDGDPASVAAFCTACGQPFTPGVKFCRGCGTPRPRLPAEAPVAAPADPSVAQPETVAPPSGYPSPPVAAPAPNYGYWHPLPPGQVAPAESRSLLPVIAAVLGGLVVVGGIVTAVVVLAGSGSSKLSTIAPAGGPVATAGQAAPPGAGATPAVGRGAIGASPPAGAGTPTGSAPIPTAAGLIPPGGPAVTGRDASRFNVGPGCSDNPSSSLPGCRDSPSVPRGDPEGTCPGGTTVDLQTTTCALAQNVRAAYHADGSVTAYSPERSRSYTFNCFTAGPGTTGYRFCLGSVNTSELYVRWRP